MRCDRKDTRIPSIRNCSRACTHPPLRLDFLCVNPCDRVHSQLNAFEEIIIEYSLFPIFFQTTIEIALIIEKGGEGHRRYVSIYRKGERGGECEANELGLDDRARCTRSVRSGRSFMHSGFFADNKIAASVWRVVWAVYSARHSPLNEQLNTHLYDAFAVTVNKKGEGGRGRSVSSSIILISSEVNSFKFIVSIFDD